MTLMGEVENAEPNPKADVASSNDITTGEERSITQCDIKKKKKTTAKTNIKVL